MQILIKSYPSMDFFQSPIEKDGVLTQELLTRFGMTLDWYLQKFYSQEEMRFIIREAQRMRESQPTLADLALTGLTVEQYIEIKYFDFCRMYAEAKLVAPNGP